MDGHDGFGARADAVFDVAGIDVQFLVETVDTDEIISKAVYFCKKQFCHDNALKSLLRMTCLLYEDSAKALALAPISFNSLMSQ